MLLAGVFGLVGGGLLAAGPYLAFRDGNGGANEIDLDIFPTPLLLVVLAGLVAVAGLGAMLFSRRPFGTGLVGLSIAPAATVVAFQAPGVLGAVLSSQGRDSLRIGGWLITAGAVVAVLAALLAFVVTLSRLHGRRGGWLPFLGAVATAGLLQWWLVSPVGLDGDPGLVRYLVVDAGGSVWPGVTALGALALIAAAVTAASARCGAGAVGTALGAAIAVGAELGARFLVSESDLRRVFVGELRDVPIVLTGVTVVVLLLLTIGLAVTTSRQAAEAAEAAALRPGPTDGAQNAGWDQPNPEDPWPPADQPGLPGVWGNPEATGTGHSWSSSPETSSTRWPRA